ncbi:hypothetical protein OESDEN_24040 [Oesophagostomum dentatum]|uniref:Uncharacterized protein n=1 Tax=Oesophagostomum dentatum TaxID=61180 RepID=A0A0B1RZE8_OESDE|nr:hypothetical protein OESDEN_24040 [Oesophagostomum dentatum]
MGYMNSSESLLSLVRPELGSLACREDYRSSLPPILLALAIWLSKSNFELPENAETWPDNRRGSRRHLMIGIAVEALCSRTTYADDHSVQSCVRAVQHCCSVNGAS